MRRVAMTKEWMLKAAGLALLMWVTSVLPAHAQVDGRFAGAVLDASGAVLPGATVTVKNEKTGEERTAVTTAQGLYVVTNLKPSAYTIRVASGNFAPLEYTGMQLLAGQEFHLDLELKPAGVTESVTVQGTRTNSISARRASASTSASAKCRTCRSTAGRCRS